MLRFIGRRVTETVPLLLVLSLFVFILFKLVPGDYLSEMELNPSVSPRQIEQLRSDFGLNRSLPVQYGIWLRQVLGGNLGYSFAQRRPVSEVIGERLFATSLLTLAALVLALGVALPAGCIAAVRARGWPDRLFWVLSLIGVSLPTLLSSLLFLYLAYWAGWSVGGTGTSFAQLLLPAVTLAMPSASLFARTLRLEMLDALAEPHIAAAVAKGLPRMRVLWHAFRNAVNPIISLGGLTLGGLLSGAVVVEKVFAWPGLGALTVDSILARDLYVVLGAVLVSAVFVVLANLAADLLLAMNDPRVRQG